MKSSLDSVSHYIRYGDGVEELFSWRSDSMELRNLAGEPAMAGELARHRARIGRALGIEWPTRSAPRP